MTDVIHGGVFMSEDRRMHKCNFLPVLDGLTKLGKFTPYSIFCQTNALYWTWCSWNRFIVGMGYRQREMDRGGQTEGDREKKRFYI